MRNPICLWLAIIGLVLMNVSIVCMIWGAVLNFAILFTVTAVSYFVSPLLFGLYMLGEDMSWGYYWVCLAILSVFVCFLAITMIGMSLLIA